MAMDYPNPLHWDQEFAHDSKFGGLIAPQSIAAGEGQEVGEHFATLEQRAREVDTVYALLGETLLERTTQDWLELLRSLDIPAAPVHTLDELFDNPHLNAVGFFETVDTPNGPVRFPGTPTWFSRTPGRIVGPAPRLGAHTQQIMGELGMAAGGEG